MEAQLSETLTYSSQNYANSFFAQLPTDTRFLQCTYHKIMPTRSIDSMDLEFTLEKFEAANIYVIQDTLLEVRLRIINKETKKLPEITELVAPRNNVLHTLFEKLTMYVNDTLITIAPQNYPYKAYIVNVLTYPLASKITHLTTQGWYSDSSGYFDDTNPALNSGFGERMSWFREGFDQQKPYRQEGAMFIGRLMHDLIACETGLPPGLIFKYFLFFSS